MANSLTNIMPKILARSLMALREQTVMPRLVNSSYSRDAARKGQTIDVPIPAELTATDVTPSNTPPTPASVTPTVAQVQLTNWKKNNFHLTDKEIGEIMANEHFVPMQMSEAVRGLANAVNESIFAKYTGIYGYVGTAGTTPFGSGVGVESATNLRKVLNQQRAPRDMRRAVLDYDAEAAALALAQFSDLEKTGDRDVKLEGELGRKYGFDWFSDDHVPTHTAGTASGATTDNAGYALGVKTVTLASAGTGTILVGDIITFAGDTQTYVVTTGDSDVSNGGTISFEPGLKVAIETSAHAITVKADHVVNLGFHRDAFAFANRPLMVDDVDGELGTRILSMTDPLSGLSMRLEVSRQYKQTVWELDILWGVELVRRELACRLAG